MIWSFPKRRHWRCCWQRQGTTTAYSPSPCHSWYLHWVPTHLHMRLAEKVIKVSTILIRWEWTMMVVELIYYLAVPENAVAVLGYGYEMTRPIITIHVTNGEHRQVGWIALIFPMGDTKKFSKAGECVYDFYIGFVYRHTHFDWLHAS